MIAIPRLPHPTILKGGQAVLIFFRAEDDGDLIPRLSKRLIDGNTEELALVSEAFDTGLHVVISLSGCFRGAGMLEFTGKVARERSGLVPPDTVINIRFLLSDEGTPTQLESVHMFVPILDE